MKQHRLLTMGEFFCRRASTHQRTGGRATRAGRIGRLPPAVVVVLVLASSVWANGSPPADTFDAAVAVAWFDLLYDVVKTENLSPPVAARTYGIASVTLYEAIVPGAPARQSLVGQLNDLASLPQPQQHKKYHWPTVANSALATMLRQLFPS